VEKRDEGKDAEAEELLGRVLEKKAEGGDPRLHFNAGAAAYKAGEFEDAIPHFAHATTQTDLGLQQRAFYNLGNALYRLGESKSDPQEKIKHWEMAEQSYGTAMGLDEKDEDARHNREFVKKKLEELKQQQQQQPQGQNQNQDQDKDRDQKDQEKKPDQDQQSPQSQGQKPEDQKEQNQQQPDQGRQTPKDDPQPAKQDQPAGGGKEEPKPAEAAQPEQAPPGQMTVKQAEQLLDAQKGEERALIFLPPQQTNRAQRPFKDW